MSSPFIFSLPLSQSFSFFLDLCTDVFVIKSHISQSLCELVSSEFFVNFNVVIGQSKVATVPYGRVIILLSKFSSEMLLYPGLTLGKPLSFLFQLSHFVASDSEQVEANFFLAVLQNTCLNLLPSLMQPVLAGTLTITNRSRLKSVKLIQHAIKWHKANEMEHVIIVSSWLRLFLSKEGVLTGEAVVCDSYLFTVAYRIALSSGGKAG